MLEVRTKSLWFMKRHWSQENGNLKTRAELIGPDTNQAEQWLTTDLFLFRGHVWEVLLNGQVVKLNGRANHRRVE